MEGSESEEIFESLNLNPQSFINEALNNVDELVDDSFAFFHQNASDLLKTDATPRAADLKKGVDYIHDIVRATLDKKLSNWEKYCIRRCFAVPPGFVLPDKDEPSKDFAMDIDELDDQELVSRLSFLRNKLSEIGKECAELNREQQDLERQYNTRNHYATAVTEAVKLYDQTAHEMFGEIMKTAAQLPAKMEKLRAKRKEDNELGMRDRINGSKEDISQLNYSKGLSSLNLEELQQLLGVMKKA